VGDCVIAAGFLDPPFLLQLLCVQIVQTNNNEFKMGTFYFFSCREGKECEFTKKKENLN